jgi:SAM-dependent methyltransferase
MSSDTHLLRLWRWLTPHRLLNPASGRWIKLLQRLFRVQQDRHPFDRAHGVDTSGLIYPDKLSADGLSSGHEHDRHSAGYYATAPSLFRGAIARWSAILEQSRCRFSDYVFVDIGCGKGRVLMLASEYAFREVVGVELNPTLAEVARRNLKRWVRTRRTCANVRILRGDALSMPLPDGPVVLFFFNSFEREMVRMWLDGLVAAAADRSEPIDVIYMHPEHHSLLIARPGIEMLADDYLALTPEDAASDAFGVSFDRCTVYRIRGRREWAR